MYVFKLVCAWDVFFFVEILEYREMCKHVYLEVNLIELHKAYSLVNLFALEP